MEINGHSTQAHRRNNKASITILMRKGISKAKHVLVPLAKVVIYHICIFIVSGFVVRPNDNFKFGI